MKKQPGFNTIAQQNMHICFQRERAKQTPESTFPTNITHYILLSVGGSKVQCSALSSIKCKGPVWKIKHSYEVNLLLFCYTAHSRRCLIAFIHTSIIYTRYICMNKAMNVQVCTLSSMAPTII